MSFDKAPFTATKTNVCIPLRDPLADIDRVILALSDWCATRAPSEINDATLRAAQARVRKYGTLAYIAAALESARAVRAEIIALPGMP